MAFKFVAVLCLVTLAAAGDYDYNKPNNSYDIHSNNENQQRNTHAPAPAADYDYNKPTNSYDIHSNIENQQQNAPAPAQNNSQQTQSYRSNNQDNGYQNSNSDTNTISYNVGSYSSNGNYQPIEVPVQYNNLDYSNYDAADYYAPAKYEYGYEINDPSTGDIKSHAESRDGYNVRGVYSLVDPDGFKRTVTYTVDSVNGFNAVVNREPIAINLASAAVPAVAAKSIVGPESILSSSSASPLPSASASSTSDTVVQSSHEVKQEAPAPATAKDSYSSPPKSDGNGPYA